MHTYVCREDNNNKNHQWWFCICLVYAVGHFEFLYHSTWDSLYSALIFTNGQNKKNKVSIFIRTFLQYTKQDASKSCWKTCLQVVWKTRHRSVFGIQCIVSVFLCYDILTDFIITRNKKLSFSNGGLLIFISFYTYR